MVLFLFFVVFLADTVEGVRSPERPVVPNVTAISSTEVRVTWCRVNSNKVEIDHYELFIDSQLEYSGLDVLYMAKRLKPWSWYEVKLRACGFSPGSCSPFSIPALVKTLRDRDNSTVIQSGVTLFKVIFVPTYMFILGVIAGVLAISFILAWRYLQSVDLSGGSAFELPQYHKLPNKDDYQTLFLENIPDAENNPLENLENTMYLTKACQVDDKDSHYLEISSTGKADVQSSFIATTTRNAKPSGLYFVGAVQENPVPHQDVTDRLYSHQLDYYNCSSHVNSKDKKYVQIENCKDVNYESHNELCEKLPQNCKNDGAVKDRERTKSLPNVADTLVPSIPTKKAQSLENLDASLKGNSSHPPLLIQSSPLSVQSQFNEQKARTEVTRESSLHSHNGMVVAIDNSNIYIGAQECASMVNPGARKRHIRVKLQNLVRILEKERTKTRGFACGSSPPATEHVWEVYRRMGYTVDLEERRGKDEQRVDEGLHLWIYKALCELAPGILVLATGDGMKGKSECDTSFPRCAVTALERGWSVEVYSWKHSLSSEWIKLAKKYPEALTINYLDKHVNYITFVDGKYGRKRLPLPASEA